MKTTKQKKGKIQCNARVNRDKVLVARVGAATEGIRLGEWLEQAIDLRAAQPKAAK